jgi:DNA invertase Pin-like site-specific DNA recombinase
MKAFGYVRLSRLDSDTTSPERQRQVVADLCKVRGWELVETFEDLDVSGGKESRRGLDEMIARLADVDAIVVWKLDRLARSLPHLLKLADMFEQAKVALVTSDGEVDTTSAGGRAFYQMRGVFAEFERRTVSERAKSLHAFLKAEGRVQSRTPFGLRVNDERRFERDPETWPTLVAMMERIAAGDSLRQVGIDYGLPHTTIRVYVRNRKALALLEAERPQLAAALRSRFEDGTFTPGPRALLSGLARCSVCWVGLRQAHRDGRRVYSCKGGGTGGAGHVHVGADWLDDLVVRDVKRLVGSGALGKQTPEDTSSEDRAAVERMLRELEDDRDAGLVSRERFVERRAKLLERLERAADVAIRPRLEAVAWDDLNPAEQRLALREVLDYVEVKPVARGKSRKLPDMSRVVIGFK